MGIKDHYFITVMKWMLSASLFFIYSCQSGIKNDRSFTPEKYARLGMPDYKTIWKEDVFSKTIGTLYDIKTRYPDALPRYKSKKSGVYFDRITNMDNLYFLHNDTLSAGDKAYHIQIYQGIHGELLKIYSSIFTRKQYYHREIIELHNFGLKILSEMLKLAHQIRESKDPKERTMDQQGFNIIISQYVTYITHLLKLVNDSGAYSPEDREKLSAFIAQSLIKNSNLITPSMRKDVKQKLSGAILDAKSNVIKKNLKKAYEALGKFPATS